MALAALTWTLMACFHDEYDAISYRQRLEASGAGRHYAVMNDPHDHGSREGAWRVWGTNR